MGHGIAHIPMGYANRMGNHVWNDILIYTSGANVFGEDVAYHHYNDFAADILIGLKEPWCWSNIFHQAINFVPFAIIDHAPVCSQIVSVLTSAFKVIAPSRFAQRELKSVNKESNYIPHGVRTDLYQPLDKTVCRKQWYLEPDDFVVGLVAMNRVRKMIPRQIRIYKRFLENNPDVKAHLFLWTNMNPPSRPPEMVYGVADVGVNLIEEIIRLDLAGGKNDVRWMDPADFARAEAVGGIPEVDPEGGWDMNKLYNCFDVNMECTGGEAVGLTKLEAAACFPENTIVNAEGVLRYHQRNYSGGLYEIRTERGHSCTATANHPFLTDTGWKSAKHIKSGDNLYSGFNLGKDNMDKDPDRLIDCELSDKILRRAESLDRTYKKSHPLQKTSVAIEETLQTQINIQGLSTQRHRDGIHSGTSGRGWNGFNISEIGKRKKHAHISRSVNLQHFAHPNELAEREATSTGYLDRLTNSKGAPYGIPSLRHKRLIIPPILSQTRETPSDKAKTNADTHPICRKPTGKYSIRRILNLPDGTYRGNPLVESEAVTQTIKRNANNIRVYNLTTASGVYFANNLLVHNCGVPSICTDYAGAPEYLGSGYTVPWTDYTVISTPGVRRALPDIDKGAEALARIYNGDPARYARRARRFAERFSWENVMDGYMKPFLQEVNDELYPKVTREGIVSWT